MSIARIQGENFRQFERFALSLAPRLNWITGANAAGKTTLLEAIHTLGLARSFRGAENPELCRTGADHWWLQADIRPGDAPADPLAIAWAASGLSVRGRAGEAPTLSELARYLPVQILEPGTHRVIEEGPSHRRRYLDWGVFHVEPSFHPAWRRYRRSLAQRNLGLKAGADENEVRAWEPELAESGEALHVLRERQLQALRERLAPLVQQLLGADAWHLELHPGWSGDAPLLDHLQQHRGRDRRLRQTVDGPHRAELRLTLGGRGVRHRVSRGQQKLLVAALLLAQTALIREATGRRPVLLVDDFPAELGAEFRQRLLQALRDSGSQVFLTALESAEGTLDPALDAMFHVEHGAVKRVE